MKVDFGKAFTYIFDDPKWFDKIIIPILFGLIPIVGWIVIIGYAMRVTRNVANRVDQPLPNCNFGDDLALGFKYVVVMLLYGLIFIVIAWLIGMFAALIQNDISTVLAGFAIAVLVMFLIAYSVFLALFLPVVQANIAVKDNIAAGFNFKNIFGMLSKNITSWLLVIGGSILGGMIAPLGGIVFGIGALFTTMYSQLMVAHLQGQAYAVSQPEVEVIETVVVSEAEVPAQEPTEAPTEQAPTETPPDTPSETPDVEA
ncbi:MAG TPA: hypothetical protein DCG78_01285 [Anaerolineaceae bacterium]|nr:hypothetical protein [Anaerolineaceae bacterium]